MQTSIYIRGAACLYVVDTLYSNAFMESMTIYTAPRPDCIHYYNYILCNDN